MSRLPPLETHEMNTEQRRVHDEIANGPRGSVRGPFPVLVRSPGLADHVQKAGGYLRYESALPGKLRELAIPDRRALLGSGVRVERPRAPSPNRRGSLPARSTRSARVTRPNSPTTRKPPCTPSARRS